MPAAVAPMLGIIHDRLIVSPARAARTRSLAILMSRFSLAARRTSCDSTGSPKLSHQATSGSCSDAVTAANWFGTSTEDWSTGVAHPASTSATEAARVATVPFDTLVDREAGGRFMSLGIGLNDLKCVG